jgi:hypothetical protein
MELNRRRFLQVAALGVAAAVVNTECSRRGNGADVARPQLLAMLGPDRVRAIGAHYRSATPRENTADALRAAIWSGNERLPFGRTPSLNDRVRDDFTSGRTVVVDGWVLSVTEARQCALYSLTTA